VRAAAAALILAAGSVSAIEIQGRVVDADGSPIRNVRVIIQDLHAAAISDSNGRFLLRGVREGNHSITVQHIGYITRNLPSVKILRDTCLGTIVLRQRVIPTVPVVVTATRLPRPIDEISHTVNVVPVAIIEERQPRTSAEVLREEAGVFVQKTNHGGGSAIIRGLSSNQILILVDGIRLNNSTYRLGNHQYLTTVDPNIADRIEVMYGPGSVLYGSDALGGTIHILSRQPDFSGEAFAWRFSSHYASADDEKMVRAECSVHGRKTGLIAGFSLKDFGDLRRGRNSRYPQLEKSRSGILQSPSGFTAWDADGKLVYLASRRQKWVLAYQGSRQKEVPRYDKYENENFHRWVYQPQDRDLLYLTLEQESDRFFIKSLKATLSFMQQTEGREMQKNASSVLEKERDRVQTAGLGVQLNSTRHGQFFVYGFDLYTDRVSSRRCTIDPADGIAVPDREARYPDGAQYTSLGFFIQDEIQIMHGWTIIAGSRFSHFNTRFTVPDLPESAIHFNGIDQTFRSVTGSIGCSYRLSEQVRIRGGAGQGFRAPNLSDIAKLGESKGAVYEVPNYGLDPEKLCNLELGFRIRLGNGLIDGAVYDARITDLIASTDALWLGSGTIEKGDVVYKVKSKQNIGNGSIRGVELSFDLPFWKNWHAYGNAAVARGWNETMREPVGGIPPAFGLAGLRLDGRNSFVQFYMRLAAAQDRLSADDRDDPRIPAGGTPAWQTLNTRMGMKFLSRIRLQAGIENILDVNYREHGSGINGPGRNFIVAMQLEN